MRCPDARFDTSADTKPASSEFLAPARAGASGSDERGRFIRGGRRVAVAELALCAAGTVDDDLGKIREEEPPRLTRLLMPAALGTAIAATVSANTSAILIHLSEATAAPGVRLSRGPFAPNFVA